jgi:hypothetical protein
MGRLLPKCRHEPCKLKQVFQTERRAAGREDHHWIGRNHVRPTGGNADQLIVVVTVIDPIIAPVMPDRYQPELLALEGMEWVGDAERLCRIVPIGCI